MLKLYIKQNPIQGTGVNAGNEIYYAGANPQTLQTYQGVLPAGPRRWPNYGNWIDATGYVSDIYKLKLEWATNRDDSGNVASGELKPKKGVSGSLTFEGEGYQLLKAWLVDDVSASLNSVVVKIVDTDCDYYEGYVIKPGDLSWCEDGLCNFDVTMKQNDDLLNCMKRTFITDNWQGWFQKVPAKGKKHPRYSYCNEVRPNGTLIMEWYILTSAVGLQITLMVLAALTINPIIFAINGVINTINLIIQFINSLGASISEINTIPYFTLDGFFDGVATMYVESAGCGREHPAPLIRDYITNVCDKCKIHVDETSAPIFFAQTLPMLDTSRGVVANQANPHYQATYFSAPVKRGLRRFRRASILFGFEDANDEYWIPENAPLLYLDLFLDNIKGMYNADWRLANGVLYFQRKDWFIANSPVYDFSPMGKDRVKLIEGICYSQGDAQYPAAVKGIYSPDGADTCGNEAGNINGTGQMNGVYDFGNKDNNPNLTGMLDKAQPIGATKFRLDGASTDYIYDALQVVMNGAGFSASSLPALTVTALKEVAKRLSLYGDYALLLNGETASQPKILIWDHTRDNPYENARAIKTKAAWDGVAPQPMPDINPKYNGVPPLAVQQWKQRHYPDTDVMGKNLTFPASPNGIYRVTDLIGIVIAENPAILVNYPMYFEPYYLDTLWDWFHWIDDPVRNPKLNKNWRLKMRYCCEDAQRLGLTKDASAIQLLQPVKISTGMFDTGRLKEIELSFDPTDEYGQYIELRGEV